MQRHANQALSDFYRQQLVTLRGQRLTDVATNRIRRRKRETRERYKGLFTSVHHW